MRRILCTLLLLLCLSVISLTACRPAPPPNVRGEDDIVTILLDAGHGFDDVGCTSAYLNGLCEYELTERYVKALATKLEAYGYTVLLTHDGLTFPSVAELTRKADAYAVSYEPERLRDNNVFDAYERAVYSSVLAAETEIDFMLSLHVNANADSEACTGFEIDYCRDKACAGTTARLFDAVADALEAAFPGRPCKRFADAWEDAFVVTKYNPMPSVLLETGFATTPSEAALLLDDAWQDTLLTAIADGLHTYFGE